MGTNNWRALLLYDRPSHCWAFGRRARPRGLYGQATLSEQHSRRKAFLNKRPPVSSAPPWVHYLGKVLKPCLGIDSTSYGVPGLLLWENGPFCHMHPQACSEGTLAKSLEGRHTWQNTQFRAHSLVQMQPLVSLKPEKCASVNPSNM